MERVKYYNYSFIDIDECMDYANRHTEDELISVYPKDGEFKIMGVFKHVERTHNKNEKHYYDTTVGKHDVNIDYKNPSTLWS